MDLATGIEAGSAALVGVVALGSIVGWIIRNANQRQTAHITTVVASAMDAKLRSIKESLGERNGHGDVTTMQARTLGEIGELDRKITEVNERLDQRTNITRHGSTEPEELGSYTQDRMHDVLSAIAVLKMQLDTLWVFLKDDYHLPDLPSLVKPDQEKP